MHGRNYGYFPVSRQRQCLITISSTIHFPVRSTMKQNWAVYGEIWEGVVDRHNWYRNTYDGRCAPGGMTPMTTSQSR